MERQQIQNAIDFLLEIKAEMEDQQEDIVTKMQDADIRGASIIEKAYNKEIGYIQALIRRAIYERDNPKKEHQK